MKFNEQWLREWVNPTINTHTLADQLTNLGLEVDSVIVAAPDFQKVVVGKILQVQPHPDATRLNCCTVNVGAVEPLSIVCGGVNVRPGLKVAVAMVGAQLPGDIKIKKAKLRGVESSGMICSSRELGLGDGQDPEGGILELRDDAPVGEDFRQYYQLNDYVIDIELTPNRGDCASLRGIAREVAAANQLSVTPPAIQPVLATIADKLPITVQAVEACPRYVGRVIRNIRANALTPVWMLERLRRAGMRRINVVVDVANYVMLELGQPLHAFDCNKLHNEIIVRRVTSAEKMTLLDGRTVELHSPTVVIADASKAQAIAGIMGAQGSAVDDDTVDIFLESAFFIPDDIRKAAHCYGLQTDASYRFERGVDYNLQVTAIERATQLLLEIVGGQPGPVSEIVQKENLPIVTPILLRDEQIERCLGIKISSEQIMIHLRALGMEVSKTEVGFEVTVPSFRFDLEQEIDLIEELVRAHGYDNIPSIPTQGALHVPEISECTLTKSRMNEFWVDRGYHEAMTYSFITSELAKQVDPNATPIALANPIASDMAVMRSSLWPGLLEAVRYNQARFCSRIRLFETGLVFNDENQHWHQRIKMAGVAAGDAYPEQWGQRQRPIDFFDVKADVNAMLALTGMKDQYLWKKAQHSALHPGQTAALFLDDQCIGYLGAIHPSLVQTLDIHLPLFLFEFSLDALMGKRLPSFQPISKFPSVRRDLALIVDEGVSAEAVIAQITKSAGQLLSNIKIFDIYQGKGIETGKKSMAMGLTFQNPSRTLIDGEINEVIHSVVKSLERELHAKLRV